MTHHVECETNGLAGLTIMRNASAHSWAWTPCPCTATSRARQVLLDGVVESIVASMEHDSDVLHEPKDGWQDFLGEWAACAWLLCQLRASDPLRGRS